MTDHTITSNARVDITPVLTTVAQNAVWAIGPKSQLAKLDARTGALDYVADLNAKRLPDYASPVVGVATDGRFVWVPAPYNTFVERLDALHSQAASDLINTSQQLQVGERPYALTNLDDTVWVVTKTSAVELSDEGQLRIPIPASQRPFTPRRVTALDGKLYVVGDDARLMIFDTTSSKVKTLRVGLALDAVTSAFGRVWVTDRAAGQVDELDECGRVLQRISVPFATGIVQHDNSLWVTQHDAATITQLTLAP